MEKDISIKEMRGKIAKREKIFRRIMLVAVLLHSIAFLLLCISLLEQSPDLLQNGTFQSGGIILVCGMVVTGVAGCFHVNVPYVVEMAVFYEIEREEIEKLLEELDKK